LILAAVTHQPRFEVEIGSLTPILWGMFAFFATFQTGLMLMNVVRRAILLLLGGVLVAGLSGEAVFAQAPQQGQPPPQGQPPGQYGPAQGQQGEQEQSPQQAQSEESEPFIHGISLGAGIAVYQGDFSRNPEHNLVKYVAGSGKLSLRAGVDHRMGQFDQYGVGADLIYNRLGGETTGGIGFSANSLALDFYADYELPYIRQGLLRVFVGGGPNFIISPSYEGFSNLPDNDNAQQLGTRVAASLKAGVTILDKFRIGTRVASSDLLDGYKGFGGGGAPDFISFLNFSYRFNLK
jgi:hypothetical protein